MDNEHITDALIVPHITDALLLVECPDCGSPLARVGEKCPNSRLGGWLS